MTVALSRLENTLIEPSGPHNAQSENKVKLPKLKVKPFDGKVEEWQEFWDCYNSTIHSNTGLANVDKFAYLRGLLKDSARNAIAGFSLTSANYEAAVKLLRERCGRKTVIQRKLLDELLNLSPVYNDKDVWRIRKLYDAVETNHRGLQALEVEEQTYSLIVVPSVLKKLPELLRLAITRGKEFNSWGMEELLKELRTELELREEHVVHEAEKKQKQHGDQKGTFTASAFHTKAGNVGCAFCLGDHNHEDCDKITSISKRKQLVRKYGRCFVCMKKGHLACKCESKLCCRKCSGKHHVSVCDNQPVENKALEKEEVKPTTLASPTFHVGMNSSVALQTAQGIT